MSYTYPDWASPRITFLDQPKVSDLVDAVLAMVGNNATPQSVTDFLNQFATKDQIYTRNEIDTILQSKSTKAEMDILLSGLVQKNLQQDESLTAFGSSQSELQNQITQVQNTLSGTRTELEAEINTLTATTISVDTTSFNKNLSSEENTVQKALQKLNDLNLSQVASLFTCTVGATGADYPTFSAAYSAGHSNMLFTANVTETQSTTVNRNIRIFGKDKAIVWNLKDYQLLQSSAQFSLNIENISLSHNAYNSLTLVFDFQYINISTITINSATNCVWFGDFAVSHVFKRGVIFNVNYYAASNESYLLKSGGHCIFTINNSSISAISGSTNCYGIINSIGGIFNNLIFDANFSTTQSCYSNTRGISSNFVFAGTGNVRIIGVASNFFGGAISLYLENDNHYPSSYSNIECYNIRLVSTGISTLNVSNLVQLNPSGGADLGYARSDVNLSNCTFYSSVTLYPHNGRISVTNCVFKSDLSAILDNETDVLQLNNSLVYGNFGSGIYYPTIEYTNFKFGNKVWNGCGVITETSYEELTIVAGNTSVQSTISITDKNQIGYRHRITSGSVENSSLTAYGTEYTNAIFTSQPVTQNTIFKRLFYLDNGTITFVLNTALSTDLVIRIALIQRIII